MDAPNGGLDRLIGKKITEIHISEEYLIITADHEVFGFTVVGGCCSYSYFYDFHGVDKLLANGPVLEVAPVEMAEPDQENSSEECLQAYGFSLVTESHIWGPQTSVISFRNDSNGYYGGWMEPGPIKVTKKLTQITSDVLEVGALNG